MLGGIVALLALGASPAAAQFSAQPVIIALETGESPVTTVIHVRNEGDAPLQLRYYAGDFDQDRTGRHRFVELGRHERSCASRMQIFPNGSTLAAGEAQAVRVRLEPGDSTCWSLVFIESGSRAPGRMSVAQRIGVKLYGYPARASLQGEVAGVDVVRDPAAGLTARVVFRNSGQRPVRPEGEVELRTFDGEVVGAVVVQPFSVLPGRDRVVEVPLALELAPGRYLAIPILDFGGDYLAGGQAAFDVP